MFKKYLPLIILFIILIFASFVRIYKLDKIPAGFNYDEAMVGYNAYTLTRWGRDESNNQFPVLYIQSSVTSHQAPFFYFTALSEAISGVNKFALRFTPSLFGVLSIVLTFFIVKTMTDTRTALCSSFLLTISGWHIFISRSGYELTVAQLFFLLGLFLFINKNRPFFALFPFMLAALTYRSYLLFLPLFLPALFWSYRKSLRPVFVFALVCLVIATNDPRRSDSLFFTNGNILLSFIKNYLIHFSLLLNFAPTAFDPKYWMVNRGLFYIFELPLIIFGLIYLIRRKNPYLRLSLLWLFLYPTPHSLTNFGNANRMTILLPLPQILGGIGLAWILNKIPKKYWLFLALVIFLSFFHFYADYFLYYPKTYGNFNHEGPEYIYNFVHNNQNKFKRVIISRWNTHPIFFLFFDKYDLPTYLRETRLNSKIDGSKVFAKINNTYFVDNIWNINPKPGDLFIDKKEDFPSSVKPSKVVYLQNGSDFAWMVTGSELIDKTQQVH